MVFGYTSVFPAFLLQRGTILVTYCSQTLPEGVYPYRKEFAPRGTNSFLKELTSSGKGPENQTGRVASLGSVPIHH